MLLQDVTQTTWIKYIQTILFELGFGHVWKNQFTFNIKKLQYAISQKMQSSYISLWKRKKSESSRLSFYDSVTKVYRTQPYLISNCLDKQQKQALCKLRISAHNLRIETGRHENIVKESV